MRYLKEQKEFYDEVERINQHTEGIAEMQDEIANEPQVDPTEEQSNIKGGKLGKRKKSMAKEEPVVESKRSSPRIKVQVKRKNTKHSDSEEDSAESKKAGVLIPILAI